VIENEIGDTIIAAAMRVHSVVGPGLLESAYEACLRHELEKREVRARAQVLLPVRYDDLVLDAGYRIDLLVEDLVVVELKAVQGILPVHKGQLLSYLRLELSAPRSFQARIFVEFSRRAYARRYYQNGEWSLSRRVLRVSSATSAVRILRND
jgi:GxxExxY protein